MRAFTGRRYGVSTWEACVPVIDMSEEIRPLRGLRGVSEYDAGLKWLVAAMCAAGDSGSERFLYYLPRHKRGHGHQTGNF